jgi:hypothetical protein
MRGSGDMAISFIRLSGPSVVTETVLADSLMSIGGRQTVSCYSKLHPGMHHDNDDIMNNDVCTTTLWNMQPLIHRDFGRPLLCLRLSTGPSLEKHAGMSGAHQTSLDLTPAGIGWMRLQSTQNSKESKTGRPVNRIDVWHRIPDNENPISWIRYISKL